MSEKDLGETFKQYFEIIPAYPETLKEEVYRIRHRVYCEDLGYEQTTLERREIDKYDAHSLHLLLRSTQKNEFIGCVRIICTQPSNPEQLLPFQESCAAVLDRSIIDPAKLPRHKIAEASRLAVVSDYRRRKGEATTAISISDEDFGSSQQPRFPYIPVALFFGTFNLAHAIGIEHLFILTEERLAKHFNKIGFNIKQIGEPIEHRGKRIPSVFDVSSTINSIRPNLQSLYRAVSDDISKYTQTS